MKDQFLLDPKVTFLNHGSFGATPKFVFEEYQYWQRELEKQPVEFMHRRADNLLADARAKLAVFLGASPSDLVYITNATTGINIIARSLNLGPKDEVLATDHEYGAVDRTWRFLATKASFTYRTQSIPLPILNNDDFVEKFWQGVTPQTKVISISHITSPTAQIFPVAEIIKRARQKDILTIIDGAHAPGQISLSLDSLGADFYVGNLHKWLCAPKGSGFLYARPKVQHLIEPLIISWGWDALKPGPSRLIDYLEFSGTRDLSSFLATPKAIQFHKDNDWSKIQANCHHELIELLPRLLKITGADNLYSDTNFFRQMVAIKLPAKTDVDSLKIKLYDQYKIELPVYRWNDQPLLRVSFQAYNQKTDLDLLESALTQLLKNS